MLLIYWEMKYEKILHFLENQSIKNSKNKSFLILQIFFIVIRWMTSSAQVNALYDSNRNAIIIPVGMTRPFLYSSKFPQ